MKRTDLEILGHHVETEGVWDGNQIDKWHRDDLIKRGYLVRLGDGITVPTEAGVATWRRWKVVYAVCIFIKRIQWRWRESRTT